MSETVVNSDNNLSQDDDKKRTWQKMRKLVINTRTSSIMQKSFHRFFKSFTK